MSSSPFKGRLFKLLAVGLILSVFLSGVLVGQFLSSLTTITPGVAMFQPGPTSTPVDAQKNLQQLFAPFWQSWDIIHKDYVDQPVNDELLLQGAIRGMLAALGDRHTSYMDPDQYRQANAPLQGGYEGIGAWVNTEGEFVVINRPMPDSPAEKAGLLPRDTIIAVDGVDMTGVPGNLVLRRILGPAGTTVTLSIIRKDINKPIDFKIIREAIQIPSVEAKMLDSNIAYVRLLTFGERTDIDLAKELRRLLEQKPAGLILDLRDNGGGYLTTAINVVSQFIDHGVVMYEEYSDKSRQIYNATGKGVATQIPLVVLVNEGTASASEITAGAIQDFQRGKLVGVKTYGKGSVQNWIALKDDEGAIRVTIARWLTPKERQIHKAGLQPDVEVILTEEDYKAKRDPQLAKAIELLAAGNVPEPSVTKSELNSLERFFNQLRDYYFRFR